MVVKKGSPRERNAPPMSVESSFMWDKDTEVAPAEIRNSAPCLLRQRELGHRTGEWSHSLMDALCLKMSV